MFMQMMIKKQTAKKISISHPINVQETCFEPQSKEMLPIQVIEVNGEILGTTLLQDVIIPAQTEM
jgi:hypothetical protein